MFKKFVNLFMTRIVYRDKFYFKIGLLVLESLIIKIVEKHYMFDKNFQKKLL